MENSESNNKRLWEINEQIYKQKKELDQELKALEIEKEQLKIDKEEIQRKHQHFLFLKNQRSLCNRGSLL